MRAIETVAFLGLGLMGAPMAARLADARHRPGHEGLRVWTRTADKLAPLVAKGALAGADPAAAAAGADCAILMFDTAQTTQDILFGRGVAPALAPGALVIDMSSNSPHVARDCAERLAQAGLHHLDAPVSGGTLGAQKGTLAIMVGGEARQFARAQPVLEPLGRATHIGPSGTGQLTKLANQLIVATTIGAVAEAMVLARAGGGDPAALCSALAGGFADSRILQLHGARMVERRFEPGGTVNNQLKDLEAAAAAAEDLHLVLPQLEGIRSAFKELARQGDGVKDHSALLLWLERLNRMEIE